MKLIACVLLLFFYFPIYGQNPYYDAVKLRTHFLIGDDTLKIGDSVFISISDIDSVYQILKSYTNLSDKDTSKDHISAKFDNNPFIRFNPNKAHNAISGSVSAVLSSVGNLDVTNIADGLAQFLIKRGKEELNIAFFNQLKEFLDEHEECKILFPQTADFLTKIESYRYSTFLQNLREKFYADLSNLIIHLNQVINLPKYDSLIINHPEIKLVIGTANIVSELSQSRKSILPDSIINQLADLPWSGVSKNLGNTLKLLNIISQSVRDTTKDTSLHRSWVQLSELNKNLFFDSTTLRIFFGLLYQQVQMQNITFYGKNSKDSIRMDTILRRSRDHILTLSGMIENFSLLAEDVQNQIDDFKTKRADGKLTNDDYYTYINKSINIIDYGFKIIGTFKISEPLKKDIVADKYIAVARNAVDLYKNVYSKNYNDAVVNLCSILDSILSNSADKLIADILKYGNMMASIVKSESPEEAEAAIEAAALPAGSSSIKKNSAFNVSLNAYIGGYFGRSSNNTDKIDGNSSSVGVTAPVGIAISWGIGHFKNGNSIGSLSLYGTLIDVGAIAGYRLNDDSTALDQKVTLGDIFTPGGYLVYGIGLPFNWASYVPLSIGYGWQYGAKLYQKQGDGTLAISEESRWRSNWFVAIDIPLANFWTRGYKERR